MRFEINLLPEKVLRFKSLVDNELFARVNVNRDLALDAHPVRQVNQHLIVDRPVRN